MNCLELKNNFLRYIDLITEYSNMLSYNKEKLIKVDDSGKFFLTLIPIPSATCSEIIENDNVWFKYLIEDVSKTKNKLFATPYYFYGNIYKFKVKTELKYDTVVSFSTKEEFIDIVYHLILSEYEYRTNYLFENTQKILDVIDEYNKLDKLYYQIFTSINSEQKKYLYLKDKVEKEKTIFESTHGYLSDSLVWKSKRLKNNFKSIIKELRESKYETEQKLNQIKKELPILNIELTGENKNIIAYDKVNLNFIVL